MMKFSVVGTGRLGTSLASALTTVNWRLVYLFDRDPVAASGSRKIIGSGRSTSEPGKIGQKETLIIIAVPDDELAAAAAKLAATRADWSGRAVLHTSGLLSSQALKPLKRKGAETASFHPLQSFPEKTGKKKDFRGIFWAVEGDPGAVTLACKIIKSLGGSFLSVTEKDKPAVHLAASLASNALVAVEKAAVSVLAETGLEENQAWLVLAPLVRGTLENIGRAGPDQALSGPAVRGDTGTIRRHLVSLKSKPLEKEIYLACLRQAMQMISRKTGKTRKLKALERLIGRE